jgi:hypothetical protein
MREEHILRMFQSRVLRGIFGPKGEEVVGGWRRLHSEELHKFASSNIIRMINSRRLTWTGHVTRIGEIRNVYKILVGKPERKGPLGRTKSRFEGNIKMDLRGEKLGKHGLDLSGSGQRPVVGCFEHGNEYYCSIKGGKFRN